MTAVQSDRRAFTGRLAHRFGQLSARSVSPRSLPRSLLITAALVGAAVVSGVTAVLATSSPGLVFTFLVVLLALSLVASHLLVLRRTGDALSLLSLSAAFYFLIFCVGSVYVWSTGRGSDVLQAGISLPRPDVSWALAIALAAWVSFTLGYLLDPFRALRRLIHPPKTLISSAPLMSFAVVMLVIGWTARAVELASGRYYHIHATAYGASGSIHEATVSGWFVAQLALLPLVGLALVAASATSSTSRRGSLRATVVFGVILVLELVWTVPSGSREEVINVFLVVIIVRYYVRGRLPSRKTAFAVVLLFVFVVFPVLNAYRNPYAGSSPGLFGATTQLGSGGFSTVLQSGGTTLARFGVVGSLARIVEIGPRRMGSLQDIGTYSAEDFLPRALFPSKVDVGTLPNVFGRTYGFLPPIDSVTAIAITQPGDLYQADGWLGILLGMPLVGALVAAVDKYCVNRRSDLAVLALYAVIAPLFVIALEQPIALGVVGQMKAAIFLTMIVASTGWVLSRFRR